MERNHRQAILVLGMHRSGTSAVAGAVCLLGVEPPRTLLPPAADNPRGFFESPAVLAVNDWILNAADRTWYDCLGFAGEPLSLPSRRKAFALINLCLAAEFASASSLLLKDPRLCLLLDYWLPVLQVAHVSPVTLLVVRHPAEVATSLAWRDDCPELLSAALWLHHMLTAEHATRGIRRAVLAYDNLLDDWRDCLSRAAWQAAVAWPVAPDASATQMRQFIDAGQRHHREPAGWRVAGRRFGPLTGWLDEAHAALLALVNGSHDLRQLERLDQVRAAFSRWCGQHGRALTTALLDGHALCTQPPTAVRPEWLAAADTLVGMVAA